MTTRISALCFDAHDPHRMARFWAGVLGWAHDPAATVGREVALLPADDTGFRLRFVASHEPKTGPNQTHLDLTSATLDAQRATVARALELGGRHLDVGQAPDDEHVVLADPEGNELCVIEPGNNFLADCGLVGALSSDGMPGVGYFWSEALGWRLIWDQDEETAIRSTHGGPIISWGGPPVAPKTGKNRLHLDLAPEGGSDQATEVDRLVGLGATRVDIGQGDVAWVVLADPGGNEFCVTADR